MPAPPGDTPAPPLERMWRFTWIVIVLVVLLTLGLILFTRLSGMWG